MTITDSPIDNGVQVEALDAPFDRDALWEAWITLRSWAVAGSLGPDGLAISEAAREAFLGGWSTAMLVAAGAAAVAGLLTAAMFRGAPATESAEDLALIA